MTETKKCCGTCDLSRYAGDGEYDCENERSECYGCEMDHDDCCEDWEGDED